MLLKSTVFLTCVLFLVHGENVVEKEKRHFEHGHSADVDHEAFLGKDHAHDFDELSADESKAKLAELLPKVDTDGDGDIDEDELQKWIKLQIMDYVQRDAQQALPNEDTNKDGQVSWEEYVINTFGEQYLSKANDNDDSDDDKDDDDEDDDDKDDDDKDDDDKDDDGDSYAKYVKRDKVRFDLADVDDDAILTFEEFTAFLHPEEFEHMAEVVIAETMEDMDENSDGKISLAEYVGEFADDDDMDNDDEDDGDWIEREKQSFQEEKDTNKDGYLDKEEVAKWIVPSEVNFSLEEAKHLIERADTNKDGVLSYQEVIENHDVFVGSQATDYGRLLHEEL